MKTIIKDKKLIFVIIIIISFFLFNSFVSAATEYWYINNENYNIGPDILFIDVTNNRVGIGDTTPDYRVDIESTSIYGLNGRTSDTGLSYGLYGEYKQTSSTGGGAGIYGIASNTGAYTNYGGYFASVSTSGIGVRAQVTDYNEFAAGYFTTPSTNGRAIYASNTASSGTTYAVYSQATENRGISGYFYGGNVYISAKLDVDCGSYTNACSTGTSCQVNCPGEDYIATGGGCYAYNSPYTYYRSQSGGNSWACVSNGGQIYAHAVCCRFSREDFNIGFS